MKFAALKRFTGTTLEQVITYLKGELGESLRKLQLGLYNLNMTDNFNGFLWEGVIGAGDEVTITNPLGQTPRHRVILRVAPTGAGTVILTDTTTPWTNDLVYLANEGSVDANVIAFFVR